MFDYNLINRYCRATVEPLYLRAHHICQLSIVNYQLSIERLLPICLIFFKKNLVRLTYTSLIKQ